ncbi:RDD family protein [Thermobrachium celere]|uniref:RDD domain-containing protein n=1 Tax=Thermobrachium celere DSM 8682 TaxID=941824 RepID=R7RLZ5_9CLOT|nr:RDD family protein [Thermobrachium celere]CDF57192.1 hypothetical protein TCEL_00087 [Thermobrachium celere DSM 8682]
MDRLILIVSRFAAFIIDLVVFGVVYIIASDLGAYAYLLGYIAIFLYRFIMQGRYGQTLGMMLLKIRLNKYSYKIALKREIYRIASSFYYIGYIYAIFDKKLRTFHDISSGTYVDYVDKELEEVRDNKIIFYISSFLLVISIIKGTSRFFINEIGLFGLNRFLTSDEYYQSFEGDNLLSLSQDELYLKTVGRKYTAVIKEGEKKVIYRISNKLKYTEVYRLNTNGNELVGEYKFKVDFPIQFIDSGDFKRESCFCAITPKGELILFSNWGDIYAKTKILNKDVINLKTGDIDRDGLDEIAILNRNADIEIYKLMDGKLNLIFSGKIGEDILPYAFLIDDGIIVLSKGQNKINIYKYDFKDYSFRYVFKKEIKIKEISNIFKFGEGYLINYIGRNNMTFKVGNIQVFEALDNNFKLKYNFGERPARRYSYMVRIVENVVDLDDDGKEEIIVKSVGKDDVMGHAYRVEVYKQNNILLMINKLLSWWA